MFENPQRYRWFDDDLLSRKIQEKQSQKRMNISILPLKSYYIYTFLNQEIYKMKILEFLIKSFLRNPKSVLPLNKSSGKF